MKGSSYRERDYAFGQVMLTLRTLLGLMQTALADVLGVTRRAVGEQTVSSDELTCVQAASTQASRTAARPRQSPATQIRVRAAWHALPHSES